MKRITLKPGEEARILKGHPWIYDNEIIEDSSRGFEPGECVDVESHNKKYIGRAFINPLSKIRCRIFSRSKEGVDKGFFKRRIRESVNRRLAFYDLNRESARLVFGEADFLPGLVADKFTGKTFGSEKIESWLSVQFLTAAAEARRDEIVEALLDVADGTFGAPSGIIERGGERARKLEGLPPRSEIIYGSVPDEGIVITENNLPLFVDLAKGQKTGHFLDQKNNRLAAASLAKGARCLDLFCHAGGFAVHAAEAGASQITAVDISGNALSALKRCVGLNMETRGKIEILEEDAFETLRRFERAKERFDWIVLDPPAFAKSKTSLAGALRGYKEINLQALKLLEKGGILISCSCSAVLREEAFKQVIASAAFDAGKRLHRLSFAYQSPDHPILEGFEESLYLKCGIYRVV
ncbi:MAG: class I SAM-dependent rRNA methyltransferase [Leptospirales bacterium]|nr:class I SAM-dependent rRNA methyltransferase [Leptospirales bacterium]